MGRLTGIVLGAAAGGGYPQWNCYCEICSLAWAGDKRVKPRTQASIAVSANERDWTILNASPDLRAQLLATPALHPRTPPRDSPIKAVVLTGGEIDQTTGLLTLRERQPFALHATTETLSAISANPMFTALGDDVVPRKRISLDAPFVLPGDVSAELFAVPGKVPLYLEGAKPDLAREDGNNVGVELTAGSARLLFIPGAARVTPALLIRTQRADVVLFDGTLFTDYEMIRSNTGAKTGRRMGHMPIEGAEGTLTALADLRARRIFIHINNTNPILVDGSPERRKVEAAGWQVAEDGMRIEL
ncbi:MAG: pyrroloquinoline quinone biosynthesis protein PqqB [Xanthobacteraceae bacterium]